jgi:hypothetical protein
MEIHAAGLLSHPFGDRTQPQYLRPTQIIGENSPWVELRIKVVEEDGRDGGCRASSRVTVELSAVFEAGHAACHGPSASLAGVTRIKF